MPTRNLLRIAGVVDQLFSQIWMTTERNQNTSHAMAGVLEKQLFYASEMQQTRFGPATFSLASKCCGLLMENAVCQNPDLLPTYSPKSNHFREKVVLFGAWNSAREKF